VPPGPWLVEVPRCFLPSDDHTCMHNPRHTSAVAQSVVHKWSTAWVGWESLQQASFTLVQHLLVLQSIGQVALNDRLVRLRPPAL
jgi:hypothetical protein